MEQAHRLSRRTSRRSWQFVISSIFLLAAATLTGGCGQDDGNGEETPTPTPTPIEIPNRPCPDGNILTYENFGSGFLSTWCTSCHSSDLAEGERADAPVGVDFNTYDKMREWGIRIYYRAADEQTEPTWMPPAGGPTVDERYDLGDWLACNAPREENLQVAAPQWDDFHPDASLDAP